MGFFKTVFDVIAEKSSYKEGFDDALNSRSRMLYRGWRKDSYNRGFEDGQHEKMVLALKQKR